MEAKSSDGAFVAPSPSSLRDLVARAAAGAPCAAAIAAPGREPLSYRRLLDQIDGCARSLHALGIGKGDTAAVVLPNGPEMAVAFLAAASVCACAPLNPNYRENEFDFYLGDLGAKALVLPAGSDSPARQAALRRGIAVIDLAVGADAEAGVFSLAGAAAGPCDVASPSGDDTALYLHTSGTTSRPKLVPLSHANLLASARNVAATLALTPSDRCLNVMPLFHIHGLVAALLASISAGAGIAATPGFYATDFFPWMDECEPTWYTAVPTMHQAVLARAPGNAATIARRRLRLVRSSSASLAPQVMARLEETFGCPVIEAYGMTEAAHQMASNPLPPRARKPGSVGPAAGPGVAVMDDAGNILPPGATGEVVIRGANVTAGYAGNPDANAKAFTGGWFRTGDQGYLDGDGYLFLTGRLKELINRAGEKIAPREVDEALLEHPAVAQAVAFAMPDPALGEDVAAAVVLKEGAAATEADLRRHAEARLVNFKVPRRIVIVSEIPKGPTGKLQRIGLAEKLGVAAEPVQEARAPHVAPHTPTEQALAAIWQSVLRVDGVGIRDSFFSLGGDSLLAARVFARIQSDFARQLPITLLFDAPTIEALAPYVDAEAEVPAPRPIVAVRKGDSLPPLFCVANADAFLYSALAARLDGRQPVYGLHPQGLVPGDAERLGIDIRLLASRYIEEVRAVRPHGPYFLAGTCSSGYVAFEMAQQLMAAGEAVPVLALIDAPGPWRRADVLKYAWRRVARVGRHARDHALTLARLPWAEKPGFLRKRLARTLSAKSSAAPAGEQRSEQDMAYWRLLKRARLRYRPRPLEGRLLLFLSPDEWRMPGSGNGERWLEYASLGEVVRTDGRHSHILREPDVARVAERLTAAMEEALAASAREAARPEAAPAPVAPGTCVAPRTPVEEALARIWSEILKKQHTIGVHDDFFALGGDSVLAALFVSRIKSAYAVDLPVLAFFEKPTVADAALEVVARKASQASHDAVGRMLADIERDPD